MANTVIQLKHSTLTGNVPSSLANGEISINSRDGKFFYSTPAGSIITHYPYLGPAGLNQEIQFNDSGVVGSDSGLTYNKTTDVLTVVGGAIIGGVNVAPQIQLAFTQANTPSHVSNSAASYANSAFIKANTAATAANTPSATANSAALYANAAFTRANNSLDANNGGTVTGTITATSFITTGSFGNIQGANTIYANNFVANTGYIQFADGTKQYTANAGSGGGGGTTDWGFGIIYTANNNTYANAAAANSQVNFVGESGVVVFANSTTKTITVAGTPGAQGLTVDYGFVYDSINYSIDYGTL
jgi:hypothetical protein